MAQREGSVYLYLFIVACVLFMIMTVMFFVDNAEKQRLGQGQAAAEKRAKTLEDANKEKDAFISSLKVLIAGSNAATEEWPRSNEKFLKEDLEQKAQAAINDALKKLKQNERQYTYLVEPYGDIQDIFTKLIQAVDEANTARAAAEETKLKNQQAAEANVAELRKKHEETLQQLQELTAKYEDLDNRGKAAMADMVKKMEEASDGFVQEKVRLGRLINFKDNTARVLESKIDKLQEESRKEKSFDEIEPDGKIVNLLSSSGKGWIDIGRGDHLRTGTRFRVFQYVKGGKKEYKGDAEVIRVDEKTSEIRITDEKDPFNPIVAGDYISSPFYDPKAQPVFVFAGTELETKQFTKEYLISKVGSSGGRVSDKVDINTDFLVAMKNYENTPEYKAARDLNVVVLRERDLLEFIGR